MGHFFTGIIASGGAKGDIFKDTILSDETFNMYKVLGWDNVG
tara:strand:- start:358 stop:483 length:126 start_codon:yes stop_codon:yes gene_type:complete